MQTSQNPAPTFEKRTIGDCTLYRGDCLQLLGSGPGKTGVFGKIGAIVSDPPYGIGYGKQRNGAGKTLTEGGKNVNNSPIIHGDDLPFDPVPWVEAAPVVVSRLMGLSGKACMFWGADHYMQRLPEGGTMLAWDKHLGRGADDGFADCEWAWIGRPRVKREEFRYLWKGLVASTTPLDQPPPGVKNDGKRFARVHVSQKPVELMRWCIDKVRPLAGLPILDPFMGSGSTAIAALSLGHTFIGCEIDPGHFDVACRRIEAYYARMK
jgi:site-specific DNA-methyltransferase (adenine-specific)